MIKRLWWGTVLSLATGFAMAIEANTAAQAELESLKGIGPDLSQRILDERQRAPFKDWSDLMSRVAGLRKASAQRLSRQGLVVNGEPFKPAGKADGPVGAAD